ncbi:MAG: response regulator [Cryomorphaceae bacterium]
METSVKILVVEDEMIIAAKVGMFLSELGYEVTAMLPGAEEALAHLENHRPDLALLDIQLGGPMDGIALASELREKYQLPAIFLTANADDATFERAKAARPFAFLQKPFRKMELKRTLELAIARMANHGEEAPEKENENDGYCLEDRIFIRHSDKMVKVMFDDILHVAADRSYCRVVTTQKEYLLSMPMRRLEDKLPPSAFQRVHRSHIVNLLRVDEVSDGMVRIGGELLPLSPALKGEFMRRLNAV